MIINRGIETSQRVRKICHRSNDSKKMKRNLHGVDHMNEAANKTTQRESIAALGRRGDGSTRQLRCDSRRG